jgi:hypothetical protein
MPREGLTAAQVAAAYRQMLGREPTPADIEAQLALPDLDTLLRVVLDSDEYAARLAEVGARSVRDPTVVNVYHPDLEAFGTPPGTKSPDGNAIVGRGGQLLLCGGTNAVLDQFTGDQRMPPDWLDSWREVIVTRRAEMDAMGVASAFLIVPDKLAVYQDRYPAPLERRGLRPAERLRAAPELEILYPLVELRAVAESEDVYLPTDTHLTFRGNEVLAASAVGPLGVELPEFSALPMRYYPITGDLGSKFEPPIVSIVSEPNTLGAAEIIADNRGEIEAVGGHIGTRRVFRNETAPDPRVAVLFGDSFGFSATFYQGISWFMAQIFHETHFVWIPFGWDPDYIRRVDAGAVLVQGAERFAGRVPQLRCEVDELAAETLGRRQPARGGSQVDG